MQEAYYRPRDPAASTRSRFSIRIEGCVLFLRRCMVCGVEGRQSKGHRDSDQQSPHACPEDCANAEDAEEGGQERTQEPRKLLRKKAEGQDRASPLARRVE